MRKIKAFIAAALVAFAVAPALAQTSPNLRQGQVLTPAQWNALFAGKQDTLGYSPLNPAGGTMTGRLVTAAPGASTAGFNLTPGTTPGSPVNGDLWVTSSGIFARVNGVTYDLLTPASTLIVGSTPISGGTNTRILRVNGSVLGEYTITGSGTVVAMATSPVFTTPNIGAATGTSLVASSTVTATGFIPTGSSVLTNGMYLSTTNTLAWSTNSACRIALNATNLFPCTNDQIALGTATLSYADLFLASGGVINWNNGGFTITHNGTSTLAASGAIQATNFQATSSGVAGNSMNLPAANTLGWTINSVQTMTLSSTALGLKDQTALAVGIGGQLNLQGASGSSASYTYAAVKGYATNGTSGTEGGDLQFLTSQTGSLVSWGRLNGNGRIIFAGGGTLAPSSSGTQTLPNGTDTLAGISLAQTLTNKTIDGGSNTITNIANASLVNSTITVSGTVCTLGASCSPPASLTVGSSTITSGTNTRVLYNNAGTLGEYTISGSGSVAMTTSPTFVTPTLGAATATTLATSGAISPGNLANFYLTQSASNGVLNWDANDYDNYDRASNTRQMTINSSIVWALTTTSINQSVAHTIISAAVSALAVGPNGATNPVLQVDASTASVATGIKLTGAAAAAGADIAVISSGTNENLRINAKGSGTITIGSASTGAITLTRATTLSAALTYGGVTLANAVTGTGNMVLATSPTLTTPNLGTPSAVTLTNGTGLPIGGITGLGTNVATALGTATGSANGFPRIIATGTSAMGTSAISSGACATVVTTTATGTATTDVIDATFNADPTATTGYTAPNMLSIIAYPTSNNVNFKVCNNTAGSITPGAVTLNWAVRR